jgi:hypothetical protein
MNFCPKIPQLKRGKIASNSNDSTKNVELENLKKSISERERKILLDITNLNGRGRSAVTFEKTNDIINKIEKDGNEEGARYKVRINMLV